MADEFPIDSGGFSLGANPDFNPYSFYYPGEAQNILGTGGGFDFGGSSFPSMTGGLGVDMTPGIFAPSFTPESFGINPGGADPSVYERFRSLLGMGRPDPLGNPAAGGGQGLLNTAALGLPAIGALGGLAGIFQNIASGGQQQKQVTTRQASPQEQQLLAQTLNQLSQMQGLAQNAEIQQAINRLASGQLPISSDLVDQVTKAFGAVAANTAEEAIEGARARGFAGGAELLGGAGAPGFSRQMAQVQHDVSQSLVNLALGLPQAASNMQAQQMGAAMQPIQANVGLLSQLGAQAPQTTITSQPNTLMSSMGPFANIMGGLGGALGGYAQATRPQPQPVQISFSGAPTNPTFTGG